MSESLELACGSAYDFKGAKCQILLSAVPPLAKDVKRPKTVIPISLQVMSKFLT